MEVFRISRDRYANQLTSSGASGRWNFTRQFVLYTGSSRSLSTLELVVHRSAIKPSFTYKVMIISIADKARLFSQVGKRGLPKDWRYESAYSKLQRIGGDWYSSNKSLVLKVPSAIIPKEYNYIINTRHPAFRDSINLVRTEDYFWDDRLFV